LSPGGVGTVVVVSVDPSGLVMTSVFGAGSSAAGLGVFPQPVRKQTARQQQLQNNFRIFPTLVGNLW
jgi:hypothetical protein